MYPNARGSDRAWWGKTIGFLGDRTSYSPAPQLVELKEKAPWLWDTHTLCNDLTTMEMYYANPENGDQFWVLGPEEPKVNITAPRMLALPPNCVVFCAEDQRTPWELAQYVQGLLAKGFLQATAYSIVLDWCCMAAQPEVSANNMATSSLLASPITPIIASPALHK